MVQNPVISDPELNIPSKARYYFILKERGKQKLKIFMQAKKTEKMIVLTQSIETLLILR